MKTIRDFDLQGKKVIIRVDFNVPMKDDKILDDNRIVMSLPTIKYALEQGAKVILMSHLGKIKSRIDLEKNSLKVVSQRLSQYLEKEVMFVPFTHGVELKNAVDSLKNGEILLMENTRFEDLEGKKESGCDIKLSQEWASLGDIFINDAFATAHRAHASNVGITKYLPSGIGFLMEKEVEAMDVLMNGKPPFVVILGGAKVVDKIATIRHIIETCDYLLIGGGMAFTFLKAKGIEVGGSIVDNENITFAKEMLAKYPEKIILPVDVVVAKEASEDSSSETVAIEQIPNTLKGLDIGSKSVVNYSKYLDDAKTLFWNGPMGVYEIEKFQEGTKTLLQEVVNKGASLYSILGGGDIVAAASLLGFKDKITHASTGGGAILEYMEGKSLPAIEAIKKA